MAGIDPAALRAALLAERAHLRADLGEAIQAPGQMTYSSQAAAATQVFEQQRDLALRDRTTQQLELVDADRTARRRHVRNVRSLRQPDRPGRSRRCRGPRTASNARPSSTVSAGDRHPRARRDRRDVRLPACCAGSRSDPARPLRAARWPRAAQGRASSRSGHSRSAGPTSPSQDSRRTNADGASSYSSRQPCAGVARAARLLGAPAVIVMPSDAPAIKRERVAADGAEIVTVGPASDERREQAERRRRNGGLGHPPYDDDRINRGAGHGRAGDAPRTGPWRPSWSRSARVDSRAAWPWPSGRWRHAPGSSASSPSSPRMGANRSHAADVVRWSAEDVARTIADGTRTQALRGGARSRTCVPPRRHRDGQRGRGRGGRAPRRGTRTAGRGAERRTGHRGHRVRWRRARAGRSRRPGRRRGQRWERCIRMLAPRLPRGAALAADRPCARGRAVRPAPFADTDVGELGLGAPIRAPDVAPRPASNRTRAPGPR